jgi:hypothetical protein
MGVLLSKNLRSIVGEIDRSCWGAPQKHPKQMDLLFKANTSNGLKTKKKLAKASFFREFENSDQRKPAM